MRKVFPLLLSIWITCHFSAAQTTNPSNFLLQAQTATHNGSAFRSVTLSATAEWDAGSQHETGTAQFKANVDGSNEVQLNLGEASRTEAQTATDASKSCSWTDQKGTLHNVLGPNCFVAVPWFAPSLFIQPAAQLPSILATTDDGDTSHKGSTFHQISYFLNLQGEDAKSTSQLSNWSKVHVLYDPQTLLPASLEYAIHPDDNDLQDLKVQVLFNNYQSVSGVMLPFHIEKYIQNTLQLKLDVTSASIE